MLKRLKKIDTSACQLILAIGILILSLMIYLKQDKKLQKKNNEVKEEIDMPKNRSSIKT